MAGFFGHNSRSIGPTALVRLNRVVGKTTSTVLAKIEGRNPAYSVKGRMGAAMTWDAEERGILKPGKEIIETTSGNTGIAFVAAARGYPITFTMPGTMSLERRKALAAFGAKLILTEGSKGMKDAVARAEKIAPSDPPRYFLPQQFKNPANPAIHEKTTSPEIWEETSGRTGVFVSGERTGGTITGVSRYIKHTKGKRILSVAVEAAHSPVISQKLAGKELTPGPQKIQGIGAGFIPDTLDLSGVDRVEHVTNDESIKKARRLAPEEGILSGVSRGAASGVTVFPDSGERYLSGPLFEGIFDEKGFAL